MATSNILIPILILLSFSSIFHTTYSQGRLEVLDLNLDPVEAGTSEYYLIPLERADFSGGIAMTPNNTCPLVAVSTGVAQDYGTPVRFRNRDTLIREGDYFTIDTGLYGSCGSNNGLWTMPLVQTGKWWREVQVSGNSGSQFYFRRTFGNFRVYSLNYCGGSQCYGIGFVQQESGRRVLGWPLKFDPNFAVSFGLLKKTESLRQASSY